MLYIIVGEFFRMYSNAYILWYEIQIIVSNYWNLQKYFEIWSLLDPF